MSSQAISGMDCSIYVGWSWIITEHPDVFKLQGMLKDTWWPRLREVKPTMWFAVFIKHEKHLRQFKIHSKSGFINYSSVSEIWNCLSGSIAFAHALLHKQLAIVYCCVLDLSSSVRRRMKGRKKVKEKQWRLCCLYIRAVNWVILAESSRLCSRLWQGGNHRS